MVKRIIRIFACFFWLVAAFALLCPSASLAEARREHVVYFQNTPYELNVYKIYGRKDGSTMMIIGGIQGDEPGGFLSADLYIDLSLKTGNLIIVPRANFNSILLFNRGKNGDMNRKFGKETQGDYESQIVRVLQELMGESDILLNLHDGWGFYRETYVSKMANPMRYGQSIIADCVEYVSSRTGQDLQLRQMAEQALAIINDQIEDPKYHLHFMNTRTSEADSPYAEQRTSATYYALTRHGIPAFGVETSKNLPSIEMKVHHHNLAINAFMEIFGIDPEHPRMFLEKPKLEYLVVSVNDEMPVAIAEGQTLFVDPGDSIEIVHIEANYERGLSIDIEDMGTINDLRQRFTIDQPTTIVAQKDHIKFGRVQVSLNKSKPGAPVVAAKKRSKAFRVKAFIIEVDGQRRVVPAGGRLEAVNGDIIKVVDIETEGKMPPNIAVNFKGFVANNTKNTGEDRGFSINTAKDLLARYSLSRKERIFEVVVEQGKRVFARMTVRLNKPNLDYVILQRNGEPHLQVRNGASVKVRPGDLVRVLDLKTNIPDNQRVQIHVNGPVLEEGSADALLSFKARPKQPVTLKVTRDGMTLGKIVLNSG